MLSFATPWGFLALLALPLVWWLHRFRDRGQVVPVAALFLWSTSKDPGAGGKLAPRAQPIWLLRGLLVFLLCLALCGPRWSSSDARPLTVWIDDSFSMYSEDELGRTRMQRALEELQGRLANTHYAPVNLRSLGASGSSRLVVPNNPVSWRQVLSVWTDAPGAEPQPPLPALMQTDSEHWLLSDGASPVLAGWARKAPLSELVSVAGATENVGISSLVVSRRDRSADTGEVLVSVRNAGRETAARTLGVFAGDEQLVTAELVLAPGQELQQLFSLRAVPGASLRAQINPQDALSLDDVLEIAATELRLLVVGVSRSCGRHLRAALAAYPARVAEGDSGGEADLVVHCEPDDLPGRGPALLAPAAGNFALLPGEPFWHRASGSLRDLPLESASLRLVSAGAAPLVGQDILSAGGKTLISHDAVRRIIDVRLDLSGAQLVGRPEYPLLVSALVDLVLGRESASGVVAAKRSVIPAAIAPQALRIESPRSTGPVDDVHGNLSGYLIVAVLFLLGLDLLLMWRRQARQARRFEDWQANHES